MPEQLQTRSISWKVYASPDNTNVDGDNTLLFFRQYHERAELGARALHPSFPGDFAAEMTRHGRVARLSSVIASSPSQAPR